MNSGRQIKGTISKCCGISVSTVQGGFNRYGIWEDFHYICNRCRKKTEAIVKPLWILTDNLKYKRI